MKTDTTDITVVLDRSGSMQAIASDIKGGFDRFVEDQKKAPGEAFFTLVQFDKVSIPSRQGQEIALIPRPFSDGYFLHCKSR